MRTDEEQSDKYNKNQTLFADHSIVQHSDFAVHADRISRPITKLQTAVTANLQLRYLLTTRVELHRVEQTWPPRVSWNLATSVGSRPSRLPTATFTNYYYYLLLLLTYWLAIIHSQKTVTVDSAPSIGVYYFLSLTLSVCMFVTLLRSFKSILLLCFSMESSHFLAISSP